jgi:hypothetical protein
MRREGLDIDSSTLWEQCERLARVLGLTAAAIRQYVVRALVVHADETPWYMLKKGRQKQWMWSISRHDAAFYRIDPSRRAARLSAGRGRGGADRQASTAAARLP